MKILKNKTYYNLIETLDFRKEQIEKKDKIISNLQSESEYSALNLRIKRAIVGKHGSGKTTFIKKTILRDINDFFIIDGYNEYNEISKKQKLVINRELSFKEQILDVKKAIIKNKSKLIIFDCFFPEYKIELQKTLFDFNEKYNYILVFPNYDLINNIYFDVVYDFGTLGKIRPHQLDGINIIDLTHN